VCYEAVVGILVSLLVLSASVWVAAAIVPGFDVRPGWATVRVAALFGVLQWALGWLIFVLLGVGTLGLGFLFAFITRWVVSAILLKVADSLSDSLQIRNFKVALLGALVMSAVGTLGQALLRH
jgi:putative membrane protein